MRASKQLFINDLVSANRTKVLTPRPREAPTTTYEGIETVMVIYKDPTSVSSMLL